MVNSRIVITWLETGQPRLLLQQKNNFFKYNRVSLYHGSIQHDVAYTIAMTDVEYTSEFETKEYIPYLVLTGKLWDILCDDLGDNSL